MATLRLNREALRTNFEELDRRMAGHGMAWGVVTKLLCGHPLFLREVLELGPSHVMDARTSNLRTVKEIDPEVRTAYIKPPAPGNADEVVRWADISFNTELRTLAALDAEAARQGVTHGVVVMVEMGDLREGVAGARLFDFLERTLRFEHLRLQGLGTNFNCLNGTVPSEGKLRRLGWMRERAERRFGIRLPWLSGGTSVALPMLFQGRIPEDVTHFRVGEGLFFGRDLLTGERFGGMRDDVFRLETEVSEVADKPNAPSGPFGRSPFGHVPETADDPTGTSRRALLDLGWLDLQPEFLTPVDEGVEIVDLSSDITVVDVSKRAQPTRVGERLRFRLRYMGALKLLNSSYVDKVVVDESVAGMAAPGKAAPGKAAPADEPVGARERASG
ncbi:MAG: alanine racemase [Deinococcales bacterium]